MLIFVASRSSKTKMAKLKILIVDDDNDLRQMYVEVFRNAGFEVLEAQDGIEGLDISSKEIPDIIFTGIVMPRMDGFTMMESLKKTVMTANIPVVISSHMGREEDRERANVLGAKDFIIRNMTPPVEVVERINSLFVKEGGEYKIAFGLYDFDAQKLAKDLSFQPNFLCLKCGEKLVLNMKLQNIKDRLFEVRFICSKCGLEAK